MRHEPSFLNDILSACRKIEAIVAATSGDLFLRLKARAKKDSNLPPLG
jgi:hypothetical protein